jgi:hypothetical protein
MARKQATRARPSQEMKHQFYGQSSMGILGGRIMGLHIQNTNDKARVSHMELTRFAEYKHDPRAPADSSVNHKMGFLLQKIHIRKHYHKNKSRNTSRSSARSKIHRSVDVLKLHSPTHSRACVDFVRRRDEKSTSSTDDSL